MNIPSVLVSVLNWNKAETTLKCVESLQQMDRSGLRVDVLVIDNGSRSEDHARLAAALPAGHARLLRLENNLGFTGGQNEALKIGLQDGYDFVWMLNNDATVEPDTLAKLVDTMRAHPRCGAASPVIIPDDGGSAWGMTHDWAALEVPRFMTEAASRKQHDDHPDKVCVAGTANLLRMKAIGEVGLLDDRLFAYYDDNDIGVRLARRGWFSRVVFDTTATHDVVAQADHPPYFFYLMARNDMIFWHANTPPAYRRMFALRLLDRSLYKVNRLRVRGLHREADSALLGVSDYMYGRYGAFTLDRRVPLAMRLLCKASALIYKKKLKAAEQNCAAVTSPLAAER